MSGGAGTGLATKACWPPRHRRSARGELARTSRLSVQGWESRVRIYRQAALAFPNDQSGWSLCKGRRRGTKGGRTVL